MTDSLIDEHDIDGRDQLHGELFDHVQDLRQRGHTPKEIAPRLRALADSLEECFGGRDAWDECPFEKDVFLVGDDETE